MNPRFSDKPSFKKYHRKDKDTQCWPLVSTCACTGKHIRSYMGEHICTSVQACVHHTYTQREILICYRMHIRVTTVPKQTRNVQGGKFDIILQGAHIAKVLGRYNMYSYPCICWHLFIFMHTWVCIWNRLCAYIRGQLIGVTSDLPPCSPGNGA